MTNYGHFMARMGINTIEHMIGGGIVYHFSHLKKIVMEALDKFNHEIMQRKMMLVDRSSYLSSDRCTDTWKR